MSVVNGIEDKIDMIGLARPKCVQPGLPDGSPDRIGVEKNGLVMGRVRLGVNAQIGLSSLLKTTSRVELYAWLMTRMARGLDPQSVLRSNAIGYLLKYLNKTAMTGIRRKFVRFGGSGKNLTATTRD